MNIPASNLSSRAQNKQKYYYWLVELYMRSAYQFIVEPSITYWWYQHASGH